MSIPLGKKKNNLAGKILITLWFLSSLPTLCQKDIGCHSPEGIPLFLRVLEDTSSQSYSVVWKMLTASLDHKPCKGLAIFLGVLASAKSINLKLSDL